jgi:ankyrin repeat protein
LATLFFLVFSPLVCGFYLKAVRKGTEAAVSAPSSSSISLSHLLDTNHDPHTVAILSRLQRGDHPNHIDFIHELSPLCYASSSKNLPLVSFLLRSGADVNDARCRHGWTPLMFAAASSAQSPDSVALVELLLSHGADPYHISHDASSPYHVSSAKSITLLLERAIVSSPNSQQFLTTRRTVSLILPIASSMPRQTLQRLLSSSYQSSTFPSSSVSATQTQEWIDPNERSQSLQTPLMLAARAGRHENMKLLIEAQAEVNLQDANGWTALMHSFASVSPLPISLPLSVYR